MDAATAELEKKLGVRPVFGGFHTAFGTTNALVSLGDGCYLELLAKDDTNTEAARPRWMGVDVLQRNQITRWAMKSNQLNADSDILRSNNPKMGSIRSGSRTIANGGLLQWNMIIPLPLPETELLPFMVDWTTSELHPADALPDMGCRLIELYGTHPFPATFETIFDQLDIDFSIKISTEIKLTALIECPNGHVEI